MAVADAKKSVADEVRILEEDNERKIKRIIELERKVDLLEDQLTYLNAIAALVEAFDKVREARQDYQDSVEATQKPVDINEVYNDY